MPIKSPEKLTTYVEYRDDSGSDVTAEIAAPQPEASETETKPYTPQVELLPIDLKFGAYSYPAATIDIGFGVPNTHWNLIENTGPGLKNNESMLEQMAEIQHYIYQTVLQVRESLRLKGCTDIETTVVPVTFVNEKGKSHNGYVIYAGATLESRETPSQE